MIPAILHYVWVGGPLPQAQQEFIQSWSTTNPSFKVIRWDESNIDMSHPMIKDAYQKKKWAKVADIARLQAVAQLGGIYLDTDFRVFKSLKPMCEHKCFYAFQEIEPSNDWVCNGAFGAEPGHWFVKMALRTLLDMRPIPFLPERPTKFGPKHITRLLRAEGLDHYSPDGVMVKDIFLAPVPVFFPFHYTETFTPECVTEQTLAAHFWAKTWETTIPLWVRLARGGRDRVRQLTRPQRAR
jgi:hypothetical protein